MDDVPPHAAPEWTRCRKSGTVQVRSSEVSTMFILYTGITKAIVTCKELWSDTVD